MSVVRPEVAADLRDNIRQMRDFIADQVRTTNPDIDADLGATGLLALVEGLGLQILGGYFPAPKTQPHRRYQIRQVRL